MKLPYIFFIVFCLSVWIAFFVWKHYDYFFAWTFDFSCQISSHIISEDDDTLTKEYRLDIENIARYKLHLVNIYYGFPSKQHFFSDASFAVKELVPMRMKHKWIETSDPYLQLHQQVTYTRGKEIEKPSFFLEYTKNMGRKKTYIHRCQ